MPGILELYVSYAQDHINTHIAANTIFNISRADLELTLMRELDNASFPIEYKLAWFHAILTSDHSVTFWLSVGMQHSLPASCTARYIPDSSLLTYEEPRTITPMRPSFDFPETPTSSDKSMSDIATNGDTTHFHAENGHEDAWYGDDISPQALEKKKPAPKPKATPIKKPRVRSAPKPKANVKSKPRAKPASKPNASVIPKNMNGEEGEAAPKPKRKRGNGKGAGQAGKQAKGGEGEKGKSLEGTDGEMVI